MRLPHKISAPRGQRTQPTPAKFRHPGDGFQYPTVRQCQSARQRPVSSSLPDNPLSTLDREVVQLLAQLRDARWQSPFFEVELEESKKFQWVRNVRTKFEPGLSLSFDLVNNNAYGLFCIEALDRILQIPVQTGDLWELRFLANPGSETYYVGSASAKRLEPAKGPESFPFYFLAQPSAAERDEVLDLGLQGKEILHSSHVLNVYPSFLQTLRVLLQSN